MVDEQDIAESLDDDGLPPELPPDAPYGVDRYGTTAAQQRWAEPIDERVASEVRDGTGPGDADEGLELVEPDEGLRPDTESEAVAALVQHRSDDTALEREGVRPAEEAAMHVVDEDGQI